MIGFGITIWQLKRTAKATTAVTKAIGSLRHRIQTFDIAAECLRASKSLEHTVLLLKARRFGDAASNLVEVQSIFHRLEQTADLIEKYQIENYADRLLTSIQDLEEAHDKSLPYEIKDLVPHLRKMNNMIDSVIANLNREMYNVET